MSKRNLLLVSVLVVIIFMLWSLPLFSQGTQLGTINYAQRELQASQAIKLQLQGYRDLITKNHLKFQVGFTVPLEKYKLNQLAGGKPPVDLADQSKRQAAHAAEMLKIDLAARDEFLKINPNLKIWELEIKCSATASSWDYRKIGKVTPVRDQMGCGSCWDFAAMGAYEANYLIRNNEAVNVSEQCGLNCSGAGGCGGGWYDGVFDWLISHGTATETAYPYTANDKPCSTGVATPFRAVARGVVHPEVPIPSVAQMKEALCTYGPLAVGILATGMMQGYTGGIFNQPADSLTVVGSDGKTYWNVNHCVTLIGWDDSKHAWLIKNSWGTGWGETCSYGTEKGYIWVDYGSSNVGLFPGWVKAKSKYYVIDPNKYKLIYPVFRPFPPINQVIIKQLPLRTK